MPFTAGILRLGVAGYVTVVSTNSLPSLIGFSLSTNSLSSLIGFHLSTDSLLSLIGSCLTVIIFSCYETIVFSPINVGNFLSNNILSLKIKLMEGTFKLYSLKPWETRSWWPPSIPGQMEPIPWLFLERWLKTPNGHLNILRGKKINLKNTLLCGLPSFSVSSFEGLHVILNCFKERNRHCVVAPNHNPSTWEPKARSQVVDWAT